MSNILHSIFIVNISRDHHSQIIHVSFINRAIMINGKATFKIILFTILLSLGGLPSFIGFLPK